MSATTMQISQLQKIITEQVALLGEKSNSVYQAISPIKINALNPVFPVLSDNSMNEDCSSNIENVP